MEALIRESKRKVLSLLHKGQAIVDTKRVNALLANYDTSVIVNEPPKQVKTILFVITRMVRFHGGQTSILRLGTELVKQGYLVYYAVYKNQSKEEMKICASSNLEGFQGNLISSAAFLKLQQKKSPDVIIATSFDTVSYAKKFSGYKMYFVQDYEPYFYPFGEMFFLAKKTYEQGLHMVSLGAWNQEMIKKNCTVISPIDVIDFPYEKSEYPKIERDYMAYRDKKKLVIAVYLKYYGKRLPCIIPYMLQEVKKLFNRDGIELIIKYYGEAKSFHAEGGTNLGMLSKSELRDLYQTADFGMVASMSNISLVPYEMLSTGLPVIEFTDGTFEYFFPLGSATMTSIDPNDLYEKLKVGISEPEVLIKQQERASGYMETLSWQTSGRQFADVLEAL
jgi:glycosyltransferase involved in cell wall biosynthesis